MSHKDLRPEDLIALIDTREQAPLNLAPLRVEKATLQAGDYSVKGLSNEIAIERKSLPDMIMCVGRERERFEREIQRLLAYETRAIVVEATWSQLQMPNWRGQITPAQAQGAVLGWIASGIPILFCDNHTLAGQTVARLLYLAARRRWRELQAFLPNLKLAP
jgi:DNA excision repair protein ERCC-4